MPKRKLSAEEKGRYEEFRRLLIEEREKAELSQEEVGAILDRPQSYVAKIELGVRRLDALEFWDIARAIGYDPCELLKKLETKTGKKTGKKASKTKRTKK